LSISDDSSAATTVWPELTTIRQPIAAMAEKAIEILLRQIRRRDNHPLKVLDHVLDHELIERDSVAPPAA
jgi:LacI family transcriptional regulator